MIKANPNLFVNTMSYHMPHDCSITDWKIDFFTVRISLGHTWVYGCNCCHDIIVILIVIRR